MAAKAVRNRTGRLELHELPCPPWSLRKVAEADRTALTVWCALQDISETRGKYIFNVGMRKLAYLTGIQRRPTLSSALTTLNNAGWLCCSQLMYFKNGARKSYLNIVLLHGVRKLQPSKTWSRQVWGTLFKKIYGEQPAEVQQVLDKVSHIWLWECWLCVAIPREVYESVLPIFEQSKPVGPYGLMPVPDTGIPSHAILLEKTDDEM